MSLFQQLLERTFLIVTVQSGSFTFSDTFPVRYSFPCVLFERISYRLRTGAVNSMLIISTLCDTHSILATHCTLYDSGDPNLSRLCLLFLHSLDMWETLVLFYLFKLLRWNVFDFEHIFSINQVFFNCVPSNI